MCLAGKVPPGHVPNYLYVRRNLKIRTFTVLIVFTFCALGILSNIITARLFFDGAINKGELDMKNKLHYVLFSYDDSRMDRYPYMFIEGKIGIPFYLRLRHELGEGPDLGDGWETGTITFFGYGKSLWATH